MSAVLSHCASVSLGSGEGGKRLLIYFFFLKRQEMENRLELALWLLLRFTYLSHIPFS